MNKLDLMVDAVPLETYRAAQKTLESAQHIRQQTNGGAKPKLSAECLDCDFARCCDRPHPIDDDDGGCFEARR